MSEIIQYAILGLGLGALYSLSAQGLVIIYRGSGVLNFAHGVIGAFAAYMCFNFTQRIPLLPWWLGFILAVGLAGGIGALVHFLVMRPLRRASSLSRIAASLGVLLVLQGAIILIWKSDIWFVDSALPTDRLDIAPGITVTWDRLILIVIAAVATVFLWWFYKKTRFGLATSAVAENETVAASFGLSPNAIAGTNWAIGSALGGVAMILISPITNLQPLTMSNLMIASLAPALIGGFRSFPLVFWGALLVGVLQVEITRWVPIPGVGPSVPYLLIIVILILRGRALPARDFFLQRMPQLGNGKVNIIAVVVTVVVVAVLFQFMSPVWQDTFAIFFGMALVLLSITVITGYTGQISLAQYTLAGLGTWFVAWVQTNLNLPFLLSALIGLLLIAPVGMAIAIPAVRTRGLNLAIATMGIGAAIELMIFNNGFLTGGIEGIFVGSPDIFGWKLDAIGDPGGYLVFALIVFTLAALGVANVRRGRSGRRMIAVRTNERAAAALGIRVPQVKVFAFALAAVIATLGGVLLAYRNDAISFFEFTNLTSLNMVAWSMVGGVGYILGGLWGAQLAPSSVGMQITTTFFPDGAEIVAIIGGVIVILFLFQGEGGLSKVNADLGKLIWRKVFRWQPKPPKTAQELGLLTDIDATFEKVNPATLQIQDVTVRYGAVTAVKDWNVTLTAGKVIGLIGPNGAGKTSAIDAVTGFTRPATGSFKLDGEDITHLDAAGRTQHGISRSFQSLELFEDMSVLDNLRTASDSRGVLAYLTDLFWPKKEGLPQAAQVAIRELGLEEVIDNQVASLSLGHRKLVAIARAVASEPRVLLLDEPAAGLGDTESAELARMVRGLADNLGLAILLVEHDMNFVMAICDEICVFDFGETIAYGTPEHIRNDEATLAAYLGGDDTADGAEMETEDAK